MDISECIVGTKVGNELCLTAAARLPGIPELLLSVNSLTRGDNAAGGKPSASLHAFP